MNDVETKTRNNEDAAAPRPQACACSGTTDVVGDLQPTMDRSLRSFRNEAEIHAINYALQRTGWNRKRAARLLSISYRSLLYKIRRHNIMRAVQQS